MEEQEQSDKITITIEGPTALAVAKVFAEVFGEALRRPASNWRGGGGGPKGVDRGLFKTVPDLSTFDAGDTIRCPVAGYYHQSTSYGNKVKFYSPYTPAGILSENGIGLTICGIDPANKTWKQCFGDWQYDSSGAYHNFPLRILTLKVGMNKDDPTKKFVFIVGISAPDSTDPEALTYTEPPKAQAQPLQE